MNKEKRQPYHELINMMPCGYGLCNFCKFADWEDIGGSCCEADLNCTHPVIMKEKYGFPEPCDVWAGDDCWCFRPLKKATLQNLGIIVWIMYQGYNAHWSKSKQEYIAIKPSKNDIENDLVKAIV